MKKISILECFDIETRERTVLHEFEGTIEAPNWLPDGNHILYNSEGRIWSYDVCTQGTVQVNTGHCVSCNNDHVPSPDGKWLGISDSPVVDGNWTSRIWVVPLEAGGQEQDTGDRAPGLNECESRQNAEGDAAGRNECESGRDAEGDVSGRNECGSGQNAEGGVADRNECESRQNAEGGVADRNGSVPRQVTVNSPSYLHGWSHDGGELVYCAFRGEKIDIYAISPEGGAERRLTDGIGYNDGPEYSPDDRHIWFNSTRAGLMQIFRMNRDGSGITQMTDNDSNNWFAHVSPDGRKVVYLAFRKEDLEPWQHLPDKQVTLWLMDYDGNNKRQIAEVFGGQGTINVNSWAPDSRRFAFVSYRYDE